MARHDDLVSLRQMRDHAAEAIALAAEVNRDRFFRERVLQLALTRLLEIIGEAATRISPDARAAMPGIPWEAVIGMRHRVIHAYDKVDLQILWDTIQLDLPPLVAALDSVIAQK